ncbi:ribonuclease PH [Parageobacillus thermoglucosidasius]|uniref:Ribonuclease PH n=2 Tax=Parageobacillus thermoglucosidasius TaxID=1426 RepID=A0AAN1D898_PARTM|nr:ribonuclease PH [Parageobacillus thermoglucosidasius]AEH46973.1 Ribonuclease PH [Parageobacillus thermoglucosidasius C56-YS93]ALF11718.1 ribonuclease PH [Parageobacillus thermoglucosidasius]ANZ31801.1 ribonuclease PH [Parageobacillus thermoglucosidasius]APM82536.1 ribonuclease PH [Parageobacillus thermoglucosidasius]KJX69544.1 ribonuclease PH [Parageobacillus thermoglucosidasius]
MRVDGRENKQLRPVHMEKHFIKHAEGSVFITVGDTKVICTASIDDKVPPFMRGGGKGWITAEYAMLPRATEQRNVRESSKGKVSGRTMEIQRLIGRALRSVVNLDKLGEKTVWIDCDVIQADGGTRTASITGAYVAMVLAFAKLVEEKKLDELPVNDFLAATSVGIDPEHGIILDLNYTEDARAEVDMNVVMTGAGRFVEIQGTGEEATFSREQLNELLDTAEVGIRQLIDIQRKTLGELAAQIDIKRSQESGDVS